MPSCSTCAFYGENYLAGNLSVDRNHCHFQPPQPLASALGLKDMYDVPSAYVHPDWCCSLHKDAGNE